MANTKPAPKPRRSKPSAKPAKLTPQQELFARTVARGHSYAFAYRAAYRVGNATLAATVNSEASRTIALPHVSARVAEIQADAARRAGVTRESMLAEMAENRAMAMDSGEISVAQTASRDRARVAGILGPDKLELTGKDGAAIAVETDVTADAKGMNDLARRIAFAMAKGRRALKAKPAE